MIVEKSIYLWVLIYGYKDKLLVVEYYVYLVKINSRDCDWRL